MRPAEGVVLQNNSLQCRPQPVPGLPLELQSDTCRNPILPFSRQGYVFEFHNVRFRGKADIARTSVT
jgi:hypothetical protein